MMSHLVKEFVAVHRKLFLVLCLLLVKPVFAENLGLTQFLAEHQYVPISLKKLSSGHDVIKVTFDGKKGVFILDTGAITIINTSRLKKYGLDKGDKLKSVESAGAGGDIQVDFYPGITLNFDGGFVWSPKKIGSTDIKAVSRAISSSTGVRIDGLIGMDLLVEFNAIIDIPQRTVYLRPNKQPVEDCFSDDLARYFAQNAFRLTKLHSFYLEPIDATYLAVDIKINEIDGLLTIDSGAGQSLLSSDSLSLFNLKKRRRSSRQDNFGAGGRFRTKRYVLDSFLVAGKVAELNVISTADLSAVVNYVEKHSGIVVHGVLGQDYLSPKKAVIDIGNNRMFVKP